MFHFPMGHVRHSLTYYYFYLLSAWSRFAPANLQDGRWERALRRIRDALDHTLEAYAT